MERLTKQPKDTVLCNYEKSDCNDSCMYGTCNWSKKAHERLKEYEDTGLTPEEIENLKIELESMRSAANSLKMHYKKAKSEAIKEFAERLKKLYEGNLICGSKVLKNDIEELVREMTEEKNHG